MEQSRYDALAEEKDTLQAAYDELSSRHDDCAGELDDLTEKKKQADADLDALKEAAGPFLDLPAERQAELLAVVDLTAQKGALENEVASLQGQLEALNADAIRIKGEARQFPAGYLYAGQDFDAGRYKVYGGSSNFIVYSSGGTLRVNIILGGAYGVEEYIYTFASGDEVQAGSAFSMVPVE